MYWSWNFAQWLTFNHSIILQSLSLFTKKWLEFCYGWNFVIGLNKNSRDKKSKPPSGHIVTQLHMLMFIDWHNISCCPIFLPVPAIINWFITHSASQYPPHSLTATPFFDLHTHQSLDMPQLITNIGVSAQNVNHTSRTLQLEFCSSRLLLNGTSV